MKKFFTLIFILSGLLSTAQDSTITRFVFPGGRIFEMFPGGGTAGSLTGAQIIDSINTQLGGTGWQTSGTDNSLSEANQTVSVVGRTINTTGSGTLLLQDNGSTTAKVGGNNDVAMYVKGLEAMDDGSLLIPFYSPPQLPVLDLGSNLASNYTGVIIRDINDDELYYSDGTSWIQISNAASGTYPATAGKYYITSQSTKKTLSDADFAAGANYKSIWMNWTANDTLVLSDAVTSTYYEKPAVTVPMETDSTLIQATGDDFIVYAGSMDTISAFVHKSRRPATLIKMDANKWYLVAEGAPHTIETDPILETAPAFFFAPTTIDPDAVADGDAISGSNVWNDASGNGFHATLGSGTFELNIQPGVGRQIRWTSPGYFDIPDDPALDIVPGTNAFTMMFRVGEGLNPDGSGYAISKAPATSNLRTGIYFDAPGSFADVLIGGTGIAVSPDSFTANALVIATVSTTVLNMWVDGVQVVTNASIGTNDPTGQSWNIGGRSDGGYLAGIGYTMDMAAMVKREITEQERLAIEAKYQINP